jgi:hypothetical protein
MSIVPRFWPYLGRYSFLDGPVAGLTILLGAFGFIMICGIKRACCGYKGQTVSSTDRRMPGQLELKKVLR